jgi:hypothetical protein
MQPTLTTLLSPSPAYPVLPSPWMVTRLKLPLVAAPVLLLPTTTAEFPIPLLASAFGVLVDDRIGLRCGCAHRRGDATSDTECNHQGSG